MPQTRFTPLCNQYWDLIKRVHHIIQTDVINTADTQLVSRPASIRRRDNAYKVLFIRVLRWLHSLELLNGDMHVQAIGAGARGIYELYIDLGWLKSHRDEKFLDRFREFADVDRYRSASKVVERRNAPGSLLTDEGIRPILQHIKALDDRAAKRGHTSMKGLVLSLWGANGNGEPKWPKHWSGENDLAKRANGISAECADEYYQIYPMLCALIHPGPTAEVGTELGDAEWREKLVAFGFGQAYEFARRSTDLFIDLVGIRPHLAGYDAACRQLDEWERDARRELPM